MKTFKFLRILFLAIFSLSIISCTNNGEDDDMGSLSSSSGKSYKKLVQMNMKYDESEYDESEEERLYFNYDKNGTLTSLDYEYYVDGLFDEGETIYFKWDNNIISSSEDGFEWENLYQIQDGKAVKKLTGGAATEFEYDNNGHIAIIYSKNNRSKTIYTWKEGKLIKQTYSYISDSEWFYSESENTEYSYYSHTPERCNGFFPNMALEYSGLYMFCAIPWIFGMEQQELPQKIEIEDTNSASSTIMRTKKLFTYTYYGDGYLKTCTERYSSAYGSNEPQNYTAVYEYFWQ